MAGSGTTLVECKLLKRNAIGVDINPDAAMVTRNRLDFPYTPLDEEYHEPDIKTYTGDARNLKRIPDNSIDLISMSLGTTEYSQALNDSSASADF